jgi:very-short-patch-repair endonuclease
MSQVQRRQSDLIAGSRRSRGLRVVDYRARLMRCGQTDAEKKLWKELRGQRFAGLRFRRHLPIGEFIVDFCCRRRKLVVEVDGGQHADGYGYDSWRTEMLERRGYRVMRFWNHQVQTNIGGVIEAILDCARYSSPLPLEGSALSERRAHLTLRSGSPDEGANSFS